MLNTISARKIQREYKKVFEQANQENEPIIVVANNKPVGAIISLNLLDKLEKKLTLEQLTKEALEEYKAGKTKTIETEDDWKKFKEGVLNDAL